MNTTATADRYESARIRLEYLERWLELALRPSEEECHEEDKDMLRYEFDDCNELSRRCLEARQTMNDATISRLPQHICSDAELTPKPSSIDGTGMGLYYTPSQHRTIPKGTVVCHYWGHIHNFQSTTKLTDKSYLMLVQGQVLVDPGPLPEIKARYINDPYNERYTNVEFRPKDTYAEVISLRDIEPGEELFVSYGSAYWAGQGYTPKMKK